MSSIEVTADHLTKIANLVQATVPHLEKSASDDEQLEKAANDVAAQMVRLHLIRPDNQEHVVKDIIDGRFPKLAEAVRFVADHVGEPTSQMGKAASVGKPEKRTADDIWNAGFNLNA